MAKIDGYLKSIEKFGAQGLVLTSGQAVALRFPTGNRNATQVTPHEQLVALVREVAPPPALNAIDQSRPAQFELESEGKRFSISVTAKPGMWQVTIGPAAPVAAAAPPPAQPAPAAQAPARRATTNVESAPDEMAIERGQYDGGASAAPATVTASGSPLLDQLTAAARGARASDLILATGSPPMMKAASGELAPVGDRGLLDAETISRELGVIAPAVARAAWTETGAGVFTYADGGGRVRASLSRDQRGPGATLRLLAAEPPAFDRLGLPREVAGWLDRSGLVLVAGASGTGKTTVLAALIRALGEKRRRVVSIEDPIELVQQNAAVSQRAVGVHVPSIAAGVAGAMHEGAEVIAVGDIATGEAARAAIDAMAAGHLVLAAIASPTARMAADVLVDLVPADRRELVLSLLGEAHLGTIGATSRGGQRAFEAVPGAGAG